MAAGGDGELPPGDGGAGGGGGAAGPGGGGEIVFVIDWLRYTSVQIV